MGDLICYGLRLRGRDHTKLSIPCQDSYKYMIINDEIVIAAIADGVGSAQFAETGSKTATKKSIEYIKDNINTVNNDDYCTLIKNSFIYAMDSIRIISTKENNDLDEYDTTLTLAIYKDGMLYYGHAGDSAMIAITKEGDYIHVTTQQKGQDGVSLIPLRFGPATWEINKIKKSVSSIMLSSDGLYDTVIAPNILKRENNDINISFVKNLMDLNFIMGKQKSKELRKSTIRLLNGKDLDFIRDDISVIVIMNRNKIPEKKDDNYYTEPDWNELYKKYQNELYPNRE